jgi:hypothetical protein
VGGQPVNAAACGKPILEAGQLPYAPSSRSYPLLDRVHLAESFLCRSLPARDSVLTKFLRPSARAVWARCFGLGIPSWAETSHLKALPEVFAFDADRMARFEREAQVLALLNHSNIAAIYGLEESDGYWDATRCINWFPRIWPTAVLGILDAER